jgi:hypothetical protein
VDFLSRFVDTLPQAFSALWEFIDGFYGVMVAIVSAAIVAGFALLALRLRDGHEWLSAIFGVLGGFVAFWWLFGMLPSAWLYFADSNRDLLEGTLMPGPLPYMDNAYEVFRDVVVVAETGLAIMVFIALASWIQKHYPRGLAEDEEKTPATGGYK